VIDDDSGDDDSGDLACERDKAFGDRNDLGR